MPLRWRSHPVAESAEPLVTPAHLTRAHRGDDAATSADLNVEATAACLNVHVAQLCLVALIKADIKAGIDLPMVMSHVRRARKRRGLQLSIYRWRWCSGLIRKERSPRIVCE